MTKPAPLETAAHTVAGNDRDGRSIRVDYFTDRVTVNGVEVDHNTATEAIARIQGDRTDIWLTS